MSTQSDNIQSANEHIAVIGAGSWGLTLANLFAAERQELGHGAVRVYTRTQAKAQHLEMERCTEKPLVKPLSPIISFSHDLERTVHGAKHVVVVCTSQTMSEVALGLKDLPGAADRFYISAVKGLELSTLRRMSEILSDSLPAERVAVLSGPNLAHEVLNGLPTASVVASRNLDVARGLQKVLSGKRFRVYANDDLIGVELGGTLKNYIAIAAGICDGLNLGINAKASLLTRGLSENVRLAIAMGAERATLSGLAGMGDLFATCAGPLSRNYRVGFELTGDKSLEEIVANLGSVAEGVPTTHAVCILSQRLGLELPIATQVAATLKGLASCQSAIMALLSRPLASEA